MRLGINNNGMLGTVASDSCANSVKRFRIVSFCSAQTDGARQERRRAQPRQHIIHYTQLAPNYLQLLI